MTPLTATEVAELYWSCLREQRNVGCPWEVFRCIPPELQRIAPLERRLTWRRPEPGMRLLSTMRVYSDERAHEMLRELGFDVLSELAGGYESAKTNFISAVCAYQQNILTLKYYGY